MESEHAWELIHKMTDSITGWTPPQIRLMDQAFQSWAALIQRDAAETTAVGIQRLTAKSRAEPDPKAEPKPPNHPSKKARRK